MDAGQTKTPNVSYTTMHQPGAKPAENRSKLSYPVHPGLSLLNRTHLQQKAKKTLKPCARYREHNNVAL